MLACPAAVTPGFFVGFPYMSRKRFTYRTAAILRDGYNVSGRNNRAGEEKRSEFSGQPTIRRTLLLGKSALKAPQTRL